jgi:hypothetical protein
MLKLRRDLKRPLTVQEIDGNFEFLDGKGGELLK